MTPIGRLKNLLGHIEGTSIQSDPVYLLVAISRDQMEEAWRALWAIEKAENEAKEKT